MKRCAEQFKKATVNDALIKKMKQKRNVSIATFACLCLEQKPYFELFKCDADKKSGTKRHSSQIQKHANGMCDASLMIENVCDKLKETSVVTKKRMESECKPRIE
jgi:hypothetical protein